MVVRNGAVLCTDVHIPSALPTCQLLADVHGQPHGPALLSLRRRLALALLAGGLGGRRLALIVLCTRSSCSSLSSYDR
jgi:hypothetical protein